MRSDIIKSFKKRPPLSKCVVCETIDDLKKRYGSIVGSESGDLSNISDRSWGSHTQNDGGVSIYNQREFAHS